MTREIEEQEIEIEGYITACCFTESRHTGGVVMYVKNKLEFKIVLSESVMFLFKYIILIL